AAPQRQRLFRQHPQAGLVVEQEILARPRVQDLAGDLRPLQRAGARVEVKEVGGFSRRQGIRVGRAQLLDVDNGRVQKEFTALDLARLRVPFGREAAA